MLIHQYKRQLTWAVTVLAALLALQIWLAPPAAPPAPGHLPTLLQGWRKYAFLANFLAAWWVRWAAALVTWFPPDRPRSVFFWAQAVFFCVWTVGGVAAQAMAA